jgi:elongation factor Ts
MAEITAAAVKALREKTDLPMMECKKALTEAGGDEAKAIAILKEQFKKIQIKRADNLTLEGRIFIASNDAGSEAAMVEIQCESAPVGTGEVLRDFGQALADHLLNGPGAATPDALLEIVNKIREKIVINRIARVKGPVGGYVHHNFKTGVLVCATGKAGHSDLLRDVAMHVAALRPVVTKAEELDASIVKAERERLTAEARASGKPENILEKMVDGRMKVFYADQGVLVFQPFAKDDSKTVAQALSEAGLEAVSFLRWQVGN